MKKLFILALSVLCTINLCFATTYQIGEDKTELTVKKGDIIEVVLEENPSTGYIWMMSIENLQENVLVEKNKNFVIANSRACGAPGFMHYSVKAQSSGFAKIKGINTRPWEHNDTPTMYELNVTVK